MVRKLVLRFAAAVLSVLTIGVLVPGGAFATGAWTGGQDVLHVPLSWCAVQGSPAAANPNILPLGSATPDTNTDAVLWRRHERPTDNIYSNPAGITFRSAINNSWGTLNFPIINDPDPPPPTGTGGGVLGDIRGEDLNVSAVEFNQLINACDTAWAGLGRAGIGITAVNINLFHDATGNYVDAAITTATPIGWGGCTQLVATGDCVTTPFDGFIAVADNLYLYITVPDRTWPPSPNDPAGNIQYASTDSLDQLVGHELGHALSLPHFNTSSTALMFPTSTDNDTDGDVDNIALNATEVTDLRTNALNVPGLETDPPAKIEPGNFVRTRIPDALGETEGVPDFMDVSGVTATLDKGADRVLFGAEFAGIIPELDGASRQVWFLVDTDDGATGVSGDRLATLGVPPTRFEGADLIFEISGTTSLQGQVWQVQDGELVQVVEGLLFNLQRLVLYPHYATIEGGKPPTVRAEPAPVKEIMVAAMPAGPLGIVLDRPFRLQMLAAQPGQPVADRLDDSVDETGAEFVVEDPSFPHCFVEEEAQPGATVPVTYEGLVPGSGIHALLGADVVFHGVADSEGGGEIALPIPATAKPGVHLVTIGTDGTALTADCVVTVTDQGPSELDTGSDTGNRLLWWLLILILILLLCWLIWWLLKRKSH